MKKKLMILYIIVGLLVCLLPFAGMTVYQTESTTENRTLASFPDFKKDGKVNIDFFTELSAYFKDHFAFRNELVSLDAQIMSNAFGVSNVDTVIRGEDGWLYYTDSVDDYLGQDIFNERQVFNATNNLRILQEYVNQSGAKFLLTVAPNKNSLYGEHMPYYLSEKVSNQKNIELLASKLQEAGIHYVDLFAAFENNPEVLYLKRDSHWNNKGAVLAYNTMLDSFMMNHETFETVSVERRKTEIGDLSKMLYPMGDEPEWNYQYEQVQEYQFVSENTNVEDDWLEIACEQGEGSMLMFRDSFGNTLIPFMAQQFASSYYTKESVYDIAKYVEEYKPEYVFVEKVERNIDEFMSAPSILPAPELEVGDVTATDQVGAANATKIETEMNMDYWTISGTLEDISADAKIVLHLTNGNESHYYEAYTISTNASDYGYLIYLPKETLLTASDEKIEIEVLTGTDNNYEVVEAGWLE